MSTLRELLNRARYRDAGLHALEIHVLHRGAPGDRRVIAGSRIAAVRAAGIELVPESEGGEPTFVPYHRFLAVVGPDGAGLWSKDGALREAPRAQASRPDGAPMGQGPHVLVGRDSGPHVLVGRDSGPHVLVGRDSGPHVLVGRGPDGTEIVPRIPLVLDEPSAVRPLVLDGSAGEGGGQILRTSLALSIATGTPFILEKIRAGRKKPGLMRQHLTSVKAAALVCGATVEGAALGSCRIVFRPGPVTSADHTIDIGSAGSVSLVLQTLALPLALGPGRSRITVRGGTHALWAPPFPFLERAWLPLVRRAGADLGLELTETGFHPAGGGEVVMTAAPSGPLVPLHLGDSGVLARLELRAIVAGLSEGIARRELAAAAELLTDVPLELASATVHSPGPGNAIWLVARDDATGIVNVFSGVGDVGVRAEDVGRRVAEDFLAWRASGTSIEPHLADQVMLPIALAGAGSFTCNELTLHARTNIEVIAAFTGRRLRAWEIGDARVRVAIRIPTSTELR